MEFAQAAKNEAVVEALQAIEDKIGARGMLVSLTGDAEAEIAIAFESYVDDGDESPCLVVRITADADPDDVDEEAAEALSDFISGKFADFTFDDDVAAALEASDGNVILVGDVKVY